MCTLICRVLHRLQFRSHIHSKLQRHDGYIPVYTGYPYTIISHRANATRNTRAMPFGRVRISTWIVIIVTKIPPMHIVNITIAIIINAIGRNFSAVCPDICSQIRVLNINRIVDYSHHNLLTSGGNSPSLGELHIRTGDTHHRAIRHIDRLPTIL